MATYVNCVPETPSISEVIGNANESLYGMNMNLPQNVSTPINNLQFQGIQPRTLAAHSGFVSGIQPIRHENMNFTIASPPSYMQLPQPRTQFHNQLQPQQTYEQQQHNIQTKSCIKIQRSNVSEVEECIAVTLKHAPAQKNGPRYKKRPETNTRPADQRAENPNLE
ncbi:unnamed protein product [Mytilus coruscus]|uniref:Uncharacterized protein n=1 Tax=Mytilus coruscus TaxID=42192 RepID=A0A6J7ZRS2_MYTCO|nr:unnamed protein product [Mytilus coruscus]